MTRGAHAPAAGKRSSTCTCDAKACLPQTACNAPHMVCLPLAHRSTASQAPCNTNHPSSHQPVTHQAHTFDSARTTPSAPPHALEGLHRRARHPSNSYHTQASTTRLPRVPTALPHPIPAYWRHYSTTHSTNSPNNTPSSTSSSTSSSASTTSGSTCGSTQPPAAGLLAILPPAAHPYALLMRLDKPIGTWLLLWPGLWSIALAAPPGAMPDWWLVSLFAAGSLVRPG